ncbi:N-methyl-L-tryptophan oxidase [Brevibacillus fulvus]|uniref:Sarcosine oxidase/N-methyl-L-tryptophan oxidase n=1 Tax=Brevibacillus fulvus TaxID=1125967 RepID=A0A939BNL6_9BACL|nr:N-methyl-L-tryptophan oxidase [Brevibacillus fulvus]MBM7589260.1 sarcosine oxidase/N-methyl-L-tryptophan oxidase [Brevibacillus fulvus]
MDTQYDVIIVGAGSMGLAAGYQLAKQGKKLLMIDAYDPPHGYGSHHGDTRIIRHAYGEGREYVPLALRAQQLWGQLQEETGTKLFWQTGVLNIGEADSAFIREVIASAEQFALPLETYTAEEVTKRWPGFSLPNHFVGCFEPNSGVLLVEECIRAMRKLAVANGGELLTNTAVEQIIPDGQAVIVKTRERTYRAAKVVLSAGAWVPKILPNLSLPLVPTRKTVGWFAADAHLYDSAHFPAFNVQTEQEIYYGFPDFQGSGVKVGRHDGGQAVDPALMNRQFGAEQEDEADLRSFLQTYMPQAAGALVSGKVCLYTFTPDEDFIVDRHPDDPRIIIAAGFSGHGFKFATVIGEILSELLTAGATRYDIRRFALDRFR